MTVDDARVSGCPVHAAPADLDDPVLYSEGDPLIAWQRMRGLDTLAWSAVPGRRGFWSVVSYQDADRVLRETGTFTSQRGTMLDLLGTDDPVGGRQLAATDPPQHTKMSARLKKAMAVKSVAQRRDLIRELVLELILPIGDGGVFDFGQAMLAMPMSVTGMMMGLPRSDWSWLTRLTTMCIAADDPEYQEPGGKAATMQTAHHEMFGYFQDLVRHRREHLGDDLVSVLISTRFDGRHMSPGEIVSNCYSLLLGANVTTPHGPNFVMAEFAGTPLLADWAARPEADGTAMEESLRWSSPVNHLLRYATRDVEVHGTPIAAGDAVVVWPGAANRDDDAFPDASTFDIHRKPNKHLAFGIGPHYCIGHSVARIGLRILYEELLSRFEDFTLAGPPRRLRSTFVSGYKHVPISARPRSRPGRHPARHYISREEAT
jgi:cytochrome P450